MYPVPVHVFCGITRSPSNLQPQQIAGISAGFKVKMVILEISVNLADLISYFSLSSDSVYKRIKLQRLR